MNWVDEFNVDEQEPDGNPQIPYRFRAFESIIAGKWIGELTKPARGVLLWMFGRANNNTGKIEGGSRLIAGATGIGGRSVQRGIADLEKFGIITMLQKGRSKARRSVWKLNIMPANVRHGDPRSTKGRDA